MWHDVDTNPDARPAKPLHLAMRNSAIALVPIAVVGLGYLIRFQDLVGNVHWWVWGAVVVGVVAVCFGHAGLAAAIGTRRANQAGVLFLLIVLLAIVLWLTRTMEARR